MWDPATLPASLSPSFLSPFLCPDTDRNDKGRTPLASEVMSVLKQVGSVFMILTEREGGLDVNVFLLLCMFVS